MNRRSIFKRLLGSATAAMVPVPAAPCVKKAVGKIKPYVFPTPCTASLGAAMGEGAIEKKWLEKLQRTQYLHPLSEIKKAAIGFPQFQVSRSPSPQVSQS